MSIIWSNGEQIVATMNPEPYDFDNNSGMIWVNVESNRLWFGGISDWVSLDAAYGLTVEREDVIIPGIGSVKDAITALQKQSGKNKKH
jgi:hypothetical protein